LQNRPTLGEELLLARFEILHLPEDKRRMLHAAAAVRQGQGGGRVRGVEAAQFLEKLPALNDCGSDLLPELQLGGIAGDEFFHPAKPGGNICEGILHARELRAVAVQAVAAAGRLDLQQAEVHGPRPLDDLERVSDPAGGHAHLGDAAQG